MSSVEFVTEDGAADTLRAALTDPHGQQQHVRSGPRFEPCCSGGRTSRNLFPRADEPGHVCYIEEARRLPRRGCATGCDSVDMQVDTCPIIPDVAERVRGPRRPGAKSHSR